MSAKPKLYTSIAWLRLKYITERKSVEQMAKEAGCSPKTIRNHLEAKGLIKK